MKTFGGSVLFVEQSEPNSNALIPTKYLDEKVIISKENYNLDFENQDDVLTKATNLFSIICSTLSKTNKSLLIGANILPIEIDKKSLADMFHTFSDKDCECKIVINDDETAKVKLIAGSLSKSYPFKLGDTEKSLLEKEKFSK